MKLISILLVIVIEHYLGTLEQLRQLDWFHRFVNWMNTRLGRFSLWNGPLGVLTVVVPPLIAIGLVYTWFNDLTPFLGFILGVAILLYCIGPRDLNKEIDAYLDARNAGDAETAAALATQLAGPDVSVPEGDSDSVVVQAILVEANERFFAVFFWFAVLGPVGSVLFRLSSELHRYPSSQNAGFNSSVVDLHDILNWLPARFTALGYAVSGSLTHAIEAWRFKDTIALHHNAAVLRESGTGAMQYDGPDPLEAGENSGSGRIEATRVLVKRTLIFALAVLALMTLGGWAS